jgi:hypothetical protein
MDGQTSADTFHGGVAVGAMSHVRIVSSKKCQHELIALQALPYLSQYVESRAIELGCYS